MSEWFNCKSRPKKPRRIFSSTIKNRRELMTRLIFALHGKER